MRRIPTPGGKHSFARSSLELDGLNDQEWDTVAPYQQQDEKILPSPIIDYKPKETSVREARQNPIIFAIEKEHSVRLDTWRKSPLAFREQILSARGTRFRKPVQVQDY